MKHCREKPEAIGNYLLLPHKSRLGKNGVPRYELHLELFIHENIVSYEVALFRIFCLLLIQHNKRQEEAELAASRHTRGQMPRQGVFQSKAAPLASRFNSKVAGLLSRPGIIHKMTRTTFQKVVCASAGNDFDLTVEDENLAAMISDQHVAHGSMKVVYKVHMPRLI